jgi:hypothetical protein
LIGQCNLGREIGNLGLNIGGINIIIYQGVSMEKHFCTCAETKCPDHPVNHDNGCDPCIQKNLELGEIPACFWYNISKVDGKTDYSVEKFTQFYLDHKAQIEKQAEK